MKLREAMTVTVDKRTAAQRRIDRLMNLRMFDDDGAPAADNADPDPADPAGDDGGDGGDDVQARIEAAVAAAVKKQDEIWEKKFKTRIAREQAKSSEAARLAEMTENEKIAARIKALEDENAAMKAAAAKTEMAAEVRSLLHDKNITLASDTIIDALIGADAEKTQEAVNAFAEEFEKAVTARVKEALKNKTPKTGTGGQKGMTKAEIMKIKDPIARQKMIAEHPEAFR